MEKIVLLIALKTNFTICNIKIKRCDHLFYPGALAETVYVPGSKSLQYSPLLVVLTA